MPQTSEVLEVLSRESAVSEAEIVARAVDAGLKQLWRDRVLGRYLKGLISREEAIESEGVDWVELAERQRSAMLEDVDWALNRT